MLRHRQRIGFRSGSGSNIDVPAGLNDSVKRASVDHEILDWQKRSGVERLDPYRVSVLKSPHVNLAGRSLARSVRNSVDYQRAHSANTLAAIGIESDRILASFTEHLIENIEHLKKRGLGRDIFGFVILKRSGGAPILLPPDFQLKVHL